MAKILFILAMCFFSCSYVKRDGKEAPEKNLVEVNYRMVICQGESSRWCLQVKDKTDTNWHYFYDNIERFNYEWGYHYELDVEQKNIKNAAQDATSIKWILKSVIRKTRVPANTIFDLDLGGEKVNYDPIKKKILILNHAFSPGKNLSVQKLNDFTIFRLRFIAGNQLEVFGGK